ncbi:4-hydroxythreonine-4-phosphate dehydrogenase PdxA [Fodinibius halophilus]|uniref:4-hydroxythreonine-4-phosphate dehydrogenase PdxA n=1 Tax=Fodinibius halophilus TaxID=1736908 RepID=A0A6M1T7F8_9BACT|nr:4-hydroxythreonine-4-phosphate dehydrogenase PdxA [Fodinibius halophilus]NGP87921.1 4-hydroxythreonine-4-phosphate dehydrogenase PdxA [Fodinibius halophilus]
MNYRIAISSGDFNGIGPEVVLKTLAAHPLNTVTPIILGSTKVVDFYANRITEELKYHQTDSTDELVDGQINILECYNNEVPNIAPGSLTEQAGLCAMLAVEKGIELCKTKAVDALVTAPISKEAVNLAGYQIPGHTEFLAEHTDTSDFMMMLVNNDLRVGLTSVHIPLAEVSGALSEEKILNDISIMDRSLKNDFNIGAPKIAVLGLNPHAGDGGIIGNEEIELISPTIQKAQQNGHLVSGPHPADGFFGNRKYKNYDGILAMYHDQGLIPFKTLSFGAGVNFTAGLPIVRTSPDHGTAFDIAGADKANSSSFTQAFNLAITLAKNRQKEALQA